MTEQDERQAVKTEPAADELSKVDSTATVGSQVDSAVAVPESSELQEPPVVEDIAGGGIATGEVRTVDVPAKRSTRVLLLAAVLLSLTLGAGFYLIQGNVVSRTGELNDAPESSLAKRYAIDKNVEVEVLDPQPVVAAEPASTQVLAADAVQAVANVGAIETNVSAVVEPSDSRINVVPGPAYRVLVGPYLYVADIKAAGKQLEKLGYQTEVTTGRGTVSMIRLLEGVYPGTEARERLKVVKQRIADAFLLPAGNKLAIYVGSFSDRQRAEQYLKKLSSQGVTATLVPSDVEMSGKMLIAVEADQKVARETAARITAAGFKVQVVRK